MTKILAAFLGLLWAVHVSVLGIAAPGAVILAFAAVIGALVFMIGLMIRREGLKPYWLFRMST